ncbi:SIP domain-containing protein [Embleya sp. NPDC050154]|uniref:SIP domain-containing protein n=1 Tax=Embleya sp. NPDC050154 TaxID=3363988 RepID=UPI00378CC1CB
MDPRSGGARDAGTTGSAGPGGHRHPAAAPYAWIAGESGLVKGARRLLVREHGVPRTAITCTDYRKEGRAAAS